MREYYEKVIFGYQKLDAALSKEKSAKCIMTFEDYQKELDKNGLMKFFKKKEVPKV